MTKRKYTGGYSVSWHNKLSDARLSTQEKIVRSAPSKITPPNINSQNIVVGEAMEKPINHNSNWPIADKRNEKTLTEHFPTNSIPPIASSKYNETSINTIPGHNITEEAKSKTNLRLCRLFCLLEFISILLIILIPNGPIYVILFPLLFFILSLFFAILARKDGYKMGLHLVLISNIVFILMMLIIGIVNINENGI